MDVDVMSYSMFRDFVVITSGMFLGKRTDSARFDSIAQKSFDSKGKSYCLTSAQNHLILHLIEWDQNKTDSESSNPCAFLHLCSFSSQQFFKLFLLFTNSLQEMLFWFHLIHNLIWRLIMQNRVKKCPLSSIFTPSIHSAVKFELITQRYIVVL